MISAQSVAFPSFSWGVNFIYRAHNAEESSRHDRCMFKSMREEALNGKIFVLDSDGYKYKAIDLVRMPKPKFIGFLLSFRADFMLDNPVKIELPRFKKDMERTIKKRGIPETWWDTEVALQKACSYREAIMALPKLY